MWGGHLLWSTASPGRWIMGSRRRRWKGSGELMGMFELWKGIWTVSERKHCIAVSEDLGRGKACAWAEQKGIQTRLVQQRVN